MSSGGLTCRAPAWPTRWLSGVLGCVALACSSHAAEVTDGPAPPLVHASWPVSKGAPADVWVIDQDRDGFLWLATGSGLYRFDGVQFESARLNHGQTLPAGDMTALHIAPDRSLWIGYFRGGLARVRDGQVTLFPLTNVVPDGWVAAIAQASDGDLWAAHEDGLLRFDGTHWERLDPGQWGLDPGGIGWVLADPQGTIWVSTSRRLMFLRKGAHRFEPTNVPVRPATVIARALDGTLWLSDAESGTRALPGVSIDHPTGNAELPPASSLAVASDRMLFTSDGRMWGTDIHRRDLYIVDEPAKKATGRPLTLSDVTTRYDSTNGMASDHMTPIYQDREGTVWVGSNLGIDSFRLASVIPIRGIDAPRKLEAYLDTSPDGATWMGAGKSLWRIDNGVAGHPIALPDQVVMVSAASTDAVWVLSSNLITHIDGGKVESTPLPADVVGHHGTLAADPRKGTWAAVDRMGLRYLSQGRFQSQGADQLGLSRITALSLTPEGALWAAELEGRVVRFDTPRGAPTVMPVGGIGTLWSIEPNGPAVVVGGDRGIAISVHEQFAPLRSLGAFPLSGITGLAAHHDQLWINSSRGVIRTTFDELQRAAADNTYIPAYRVFDFRDGLPGVATQSATRTIGFDKQGRVWIATNQGPALIEPWRLAQNTVPPQVFVRSVATESATFDASEPSSVLVLPVNTTRARIAFTATSLAMPDRVQFHYRLHGVDAAWQDAGARREAFYTNLGPGQYAFEVIAINQDGVRSRDVARVAFRIQPAFYQTDWFKVLCVLVLLALIVVFVRLRLRQYKERIRLQLEAKSEERERIARELHDTLIQSVNALSLRFGNALDDFPDGHPSRSGLQTVLDAAESVMGEGRDRLLALRSSEEMGPGLVHALSVVGEETSAFFGTPFAIEQAGAARPVIPVIASEVVAVVREALFNAYRHAAASVITCRIEFERDALTIRVLDNGCGYVPSNEVGERRHCHFGIAGMRERAERIHSTLDFVSKQGRGTEVILSVPGRVAYKRVRWAWWRLAARGTSLTVPGTDRPE